MNYMFGSHARQYCGKSHGNDVGEYIGFPNHQKIAQEDSRYFIWNLLNSCV